MNLKLSSYQNNFDKYKHVKSDLLYGDLSKISPYITIAIPTYKRSDLLKEAIDSVINQEGNIKYEIIVLDNDSSSEIESDTKKLISSYNSDKLYYYKHKANLGMIGNWNRCFELARGEFVTILHDDDWLESNYLLKVIGQIDDKKALFFKSKCVDMRKPICKEKNKNKECIKNCIHLITPQSHDMTLYDFFYGYMTWGTNTILFNKEAAISLGGFDDEFFPFQDYHFAIKYCYNYGAKFIKYEIGKYRIMDNAAIALIRNTPNTSYEVRKEMIGIINKNKRLLLNLSIVLFDENKKYVETFWNLKVDVKNEILQIQNKFSYKITAFFLKIYLKIRMIYYYI